jgi:hypothetical protein
MPNFSESSEAGGDIALGKTYVVWWWCFILKELLEPHYAHLEPELKKVIEKGFG